jgi:hypothetical protein
MTIRRRPPISALLAALAAGAVTAQTAEDVEQCVRDLDTDRLEAHYDALAAERDIEATVAALCAAGDRDAAAAHWLSFEDALYDVPDGARARECAAIFAALARSQLTAIGIELDPAEDDHVCDIEF